MIIYYFFWRFSCDFCRFIHKLICVITLERDHLADHASSRGDRLDRLVGEGHGGVAGHWRYFITENGRQTLHSEVEKSSTDGAGVGVLYHHSNHTGQPLPKLYSRIDHEHLRLYVTLLELECIYYVTITIHLVSCIFESSFQDFIPFVILVSFMRLFDVIVFIRIFPIPM